MMQRITGISCGAILVTFFTHNETEKVRLTRNTECIEMTLARFCNLITRPDIREEVKKRGMDIGKC